MYTDIHTCLVHAVTRFDRTRRTPQNPYALALYLNAVDRINKDIVTGATINTACRNHLCGPLLNYVIAFVAKHYRNEGDQP